MTAAYSRLVGKPVEVVYRFCTIELFARGVLLANSSDAILLEQYADQYGGFAAFSLSIPHSFILKIEEGNRLPPLAGG